MIVQLEEPSRPADDDCCGGGCCPCVWDVFFAKRQAWEDQQRLLAENVEYIQVTENNQ
jgi:hypothetical protein